MLDLPQTLHLHWQADLTVLSLRGEGSAFAQGVQRALGFAPPLQANTTREKAGNRLVWVSPDDCFVLASAGEALTLEISLRDALKDQHFAVTDVSSGYYRLTLSGTAARSMLAQGCPLDLHPRSFGLGQCAGSHFFKASLWLWMTTDAPTFELLVRRSFAPYVDEMLDRASLEYQVERSGMKVEAYA